MLSLLQLMPLLFSCTAGTNTIYSPLSRYKNGFSLIFGVVVISVTTCCGVLPSLSLFPGIPQLVKPLLFFNAVPFSSVRLFSAFTPRKKLFNVVPNVLANISLFLVKNCCPEPVPAPLKSLSTPVNKQSAT